MIKHNVELVWITPNTEALIAKMARVSNPKNENNPEYQKLLRYLITHKHWSPFEMASACFCITTTRDVSRQILRHRSFSFQEWSLRYAEAAPIHLPWEMELRKQDYKNRQNSLEWGDSPVPEDLIQQANAAAVNLYSAYVALLEQGVAKEVARKILPEGLTPSRLYMTGTIRSWLHYLEVRTDPATQKEHRVVAEDIKLVLTEQIPNIMSAVNE